MNTITEGQHAATLDPASGAGILTSPPLIDPGEWDRTMRTLHDSGWTPLANEYDEIIVVASLEDGHTAYGLEAYDSADRSSDSDYDAAVLGLLARLGA